MTAEPSFPQHPSSFTPTKPKELSTEQETKYQQLLAEVKKWGDGFDGSTKQDGKFATESDGDADSEMLVITEFDKTFLVSKEDLWPLFTLCHAYL